MVYKDDTRHSALKTRKFEIKKGNNEIEIQYIIDKNLEPKNGNDIESFLEIYEIQMINAETSSLECQKYDSMNDLKDTIFNNCEYDVTKCEKTDYCTYRFFTEKSEGNNINKGTQIISYQLIDNAMCEILSNPENKEISADQCTYGQYRKFIDDSETLYNCDLCNDKTFNDELINDEFFCGKTCDTNNKNLKKINYINNFADPSQYCGEITIIEPSGYLEVNYEKFNLREDSIIFVEITNKTNNDFKTYQLINPDKDVQIIDGQFNFDIPFQKGKFNIQIKGKNLNLKEIKTINVEEGGNYKCSDRLNQEEEVICQNKEYYSFNKKICTKCPESFSYAENSKCSLVNQIINNKFILDNTLLINGKLFTNQYEITDGNNINYHAYLNPTFPLIYKISQDNSYEITGNEFDYVKLVRGINERGIIFAYIHNDNNDDSNKNYTSFVYIKCDKSISESKETIELIKEETLDNNKYFYFSSKSNIVCPYCLESEINYIETDGKCVDNTELFNIEIKEKSECVIKSYDDTTSSKIIIDKNSALLLFSNSASKEDQKLIEVYKINEEIPNFYEKDTDFIITDTKMNKTCGKDDENKDNTLDSLYIILIAVGGIIVIILIGLIAWGILRTRRFDSSHLNSEDIQEINLKTTVKEEY